MKYSKNNVFDYIMIQMILEFFEIPIPEFWIGKNYWRNRYPEEIFYKCYGHKKQ
jgi:hypothetical protein